MSLPKPSIGGNPAEALTAAARRLGLPCDPQDLIARIADHRSPRSLLALVEVAAQVGMVARAWQSDLEGLRETALPAVVHLRNPDPALDDSAAGFALLLERGPEGVVIEDPTTLAPVRLTPREFETLWTGVVVTLSASGGGLSLPAPFRRRGLLARLRARDGQDPGGDALEVAQRLGTLALFALAAASCVRFGIDRGSVPAGAAAMAALALALVGLAACMALFRSSRRTRVPAAASRLAAAICGRGRLSDCEGVLSSKYARVFGLDLASLGLAFFASAVVLAAVGGALDAPARARLFAWLAAAFVAAAPGSLALIALQVYPLRRLCPLCMTVHVSVLGGAALGVPLLLGRSDMSEILRGALPFGLLQGAALLGALALLVPFLDLAIESHAHRTRLGWIGSTPWGALAELAGRPRVAPAHLVAPIQLGDPGAAFRVDALVHPLCAHCPSVIDGLAELVGRRPDLLHVGFHLTPRDPTDPADRELCAGIAAVGLLAGGEQTVHVLRAVKDDPWRRLEAARSGAGRIVAEFLGPSPDVEAALDSARSFVVRADRLAETTRKGTPTLLLNGFVWDASLADLEALLDGHPALLRGVLGVPEGGATSAIPGGRE